MAIETINQLLVIGVVLYVMIQRLIAHNVLEIIALDVGLINILMKEYPKHAWTLALIFIGIIKLITGIARYAQTMQQFVRFA